MPGTNSNKSAYYDSDSAGAGTQKQPEPKVSQDQAKKSAVNKDAAKQGNANQG